MTDDGQAPEPTPEPTPARRRPNPRDQVRDELVARIDARLQRVDATSREAAGLLAEAIPRIDTLREQVGELTGRVDELSGAEPPAPPPNPPVHWPELTSAQAPAEWNRLGEWVADVLGPWYGVTRGQLPDCWPLHTRAVLTLSWLRTAYVAAYRPDGRPESAAEWHTRWLPAALTQIETAVPPWWCRPGTHMRYDSGGRRDAPTRPATAQEGAGQRDRDVPLSKDPISPLHWGEYWRQAVDEDVARRQRNEQPASGA